MGTTCSRCRFQSTHPRGVRHNPDPGVTGRSTVSIHAPAWGATGCTVLDPFMGAGFNPRTRVGCDRWRTMTFSARSAVSIHAPAWGATSWTPRITPTSGFQSTHPRGVRRSNRQPQLISSPGFQSTHPRGVRLLAWDKRCARPQFQSTHPRGVRRAHMAELPEATQVSIHAPAWGATILLLRTSPVVLGFNPRTRVGCDTPR